MLKKILFTMMLMTFIAATSDLSARGGGGFGAGFGLGLLGGALVTNAAYSNSGYGYYPQPYPYAYGPQYNFYGPGFNPYW